MNSRRVRVRAVCGGAILYSCTGFTVENKYYGSQSQPAAAAAVIRHSPSSIGNLFFIESKARSYLLATFEALRIV
eukprot:COSAG01_NODE_2777_length_7092_cov_1.978121_9_plen_75_part_00